MTGWAWFCLACASLLAAMGAKSTDVGFAVFGFGLFVAEVVDP